MSSLPICSACGQPIEDSTLTAFGMTWHPYHLVCKVCGKDFSDGSNCCEGPDGYAYCEGLLLCSSPFFPHRGACVPC